MNKTLDIDQFTVPTHYWHQLENGTIQCDVCPRACKLKEDQRGMCFVRGRKNDQIVLTTYGRSSGFCVDPIEKKPLNHFLPGTSVLSFGTAGCNLACKFCQNWDISKSREIDILADTATPEMLANTAARLGCRSIAFTYNDPVVFMEYAMDVADACREKNIETIAVTAGYICEKPRQEFYRHMNAANIDLKGFTEKFYWKICNGHLQDVLETLQYLKNETSVWFEITTLLIPGENDSEKEIDEMTQWIVEHCLEVQLPFLQEIFDQYFEIIPLLVGDANSKLVAEVLRALWGGDETLIVISSDLSHYHDYEAAKQIDRCTTKSIEQFQGEQLDFDSACGCLPIQGLLQVAKEFGMQCKVMDLRNSGDTAGSHERVVGYGAFAFYY